ncbi:hypothetical protein IC230_08625 [Spirosoma sp. BT704]|uniref:Uncharacterized protein n=1 Tax=Spirosoma validum TaxID=2771355 RepID=A0A927GCW3_9BACT|nr:hypothetical protein [Spirosoma validum]
MESFFVVSVDMVDVVSPVAVVLVESVEVLMVEVLSDTVVDVDSVLLLEQAVAKAIIESRKKADFAMFIRS